MLDDSGANLVLTVNGQRLCLATGLTVAELLSQQVSQRRPIAVELNGELLPRDQYLRQLRTGDELEIVTLVGGG